MPYLSWEALRENRDQHESKDAAIAQLEEELAEALEERDALKAQIQRMMADRSVAV